MGLWDKVKKKAKKGWKAAHKPVTYASKKLEKAARPISRPIRDATKKAVKGTPLEATVRAATDWDIRKPHRSGLKAGHAVGSLVAAYWTGGASLELTKHIDKKIYGKNVGSLSMGDFRKMKSLGSSASSALEKYNEAGGLEGLQQMGEKGLADLQKRGGSELAKLQEAAANGDYRAVQNQLNGLRSEVDGYYGMANSAISDAKQSLNTGLLKKEGAPPTAQAASHALQRVAGGASHMPIAGSVLNAFGVPAQQSAGSRHQPPAGNQTMMLAALGAVALVLILR